MHDQPFMLLCWFLLCIIWWLYFCDSYSHIHFIILEFGCRMNHEHSSVGWCWRFFVGPKFSSIEISNVTIEMLSRVFSCLCAAIYIFFYLSFCFEGKIKYICLYSYVIYYKVQKTRNRCGFTSCFQSHS